MKNFYSILEVSPDATEDQIKSQYRKLVRECHPDQFLELHVKLHYEEKLKEINQAYANVRQSDLSPQSQINAEVLPRKTPLSHTSVIMSLASLSILIFLMTVLLLPTIGFSKGREIENPQQTAETASNYQRQSMLLQNNSFQSEVSNQISSVIVQTPKLGTAVHPIAPLYQNNAQK